MSKFQNIRLKAVYILEHIIGIALGFCLFIGVFGFIGYLIAFCIGGETAMEMCEWIYKKFFGFLVKVSTVTTLATFILLYLRGDVKWVNPVIYWKHKYNKASQ